MLMIVTGAQQYSFEDENSGRLVEGTNIFYVDYENPEFSNGRLGCLPIKMKTTPQVLQSLSKLPAIYDLDFKMNPSASGKVTMSVSGAKFVSDLFPAVEKPAKAG